MPLHNLQIKQLIHLKLSCIVNSLIYISAYVLIIFIVGLWVLSEFFHANNLPNKVIVYSGILTFILFSDMAVILVFWHRYVKKINPYPPAGSDNKAVIEWSNKNSDIFSKYLWRLLLISLGSAMILITLFSLIVIFLG